MGPDTAGDDRLLGDPQRVPNPPRDGSRRAELADSPRDLLRYARRGAGLLALAAAALTATGCGRPIAFPAADVAAAQLLSGAPRSFFLGAATSAHQIEGGTHNDW